MRESDYLPLLQLALSEDLGELGDVTSQAVVPEEERSATLWCKDTGVLAGEEVFTAVFRAIDSGTRVEFAVHDGALLEKGQHVAEVRGKALTILSIKGGKINFKMTGAQACGDADGENFSITGRATVTGGAGAYKTAKGSLKVTGLYKKSAKTFAVKFAGKLTV